MPGRGVEADPAAALDEPRERGQAPLGHHLPEERHARRVKADQRKQGSGSYARSTQRPPVACERLAASTTAMTRAASDAVASIPGLPPRAARANASSCARI